MNKRPVWKTITFLSMEDVYRIQSLYDCSTKAFGKNKVLHWQDNTMETNITISGLRTLASCAGVKIDWKNGILWDSEPRFEEIE